jgi:hypothetical protein
LDSYTSARRAELSARYRVISPTIARRSPVRDELLEDLAGDAGAEHEEVVVEPFHRDDHQVRMVPEGLPDDLGGVTVAA